MIDEMGCEARSNQKEISASLFNLVDEFKVTFNRRMTNPFRPSLPRIELGFCWPFSGANPTADLRRLAENGFDGIELWPNRFEEGGAASWDAALRSAGLRALQLCPYFNFMGGEATITRSRQILKDYLAHALRLECTRLRVFTGPPWGEGVVGARDATPVQWDDTISCLREFCDRATAQNVELCLECHEGSLMEDSPSTLRLLRAVARLNLTTNLQLPLLNEDWKVSVDSLAEFTTHIHIHNWTRGLGDGELTFLVEGVFDWAPVLAALLTKSRRSLTLSVEHVDHGKRHDPWETARRDGIYLQQLRSSLL